MAESQLVCMEDGHIGQNVPESRPEFYYSEEQRAAVEELLRNGDGAFKMRLKDDNMTDFLSAREVKLLVSTFRKYDEEEEERGDRHKQRSEGEEGEEEGAASDSGVHSTYWPQMSDTEVPPLDIGWPSSAMFKGVTRVAVHTHPPKENRPHIKEVVRRLIQEASKVIAIVMDLLTDVQILQDLMDAAFRRAVPIYILLDQQGVPHFLDMCSRLQIGAHHLRNMRARILQGVGFGLSFGKLPGCVCNRYMLVDGDKVMFGSYSFSWCTSRMDRNMITVMTGQVVDFFDQDFRELYAVSEKLNLYKEFHISPPAARLTDMERSRAGSKRPPLPATTSRFQVALGDSKKADIKIPAHKLYNPKYSLVFGDIQRPSGSLHDLGHNRVLALAEEEDDQRLANSEKMDRLTPLPAEAPSDISHSPNGLKRDKRVRLTWKPKLLRNKSSARASAKEPTDPSPAQPIQTCGSEESFEVVADPPKFGRKLSKLSRKSVSVQSVNTTQDAEGAKSHKEKQGCKVS